MFRYVSPVKQFMRTATSEQVVGGVTIPEGGSVLLSFPSANRDPAVFDNPETFDVARDPNRHVAFGFGAHYCLGTHLARLETRAFYNELIPRLEYAELAGEPEFMKTIFVGGPEARPGSLPPPLMPAMNDLYRPHVPARSPDRRPGAQPQTAPPSTSTASAHGARDARRDQPLRAGVPRAGIEQGERRRDAVEEPRRGALLDGRRDGRRVPEHAACTRSARSTTTPTCSRTPASRR